MHKRAEMFAKDETMDFIAIDFETTGGKYNAPISLGLVVVKEKQIVERYYSLIDPKEKIAPFTIRIHGLRDQDVQGQREFPAIWEEIKTYFLKYPVVAHNARFDLGVLEKTAQRYGIRLPHITAYDTVEMYRHNYPGLIGYKLNELCDQFDIVLENHHCAEDDAVAAAELMIHLLNDPHTNIYGRLRGRSYQRFIVANDYQNNPPVYKMPKVRFDELEKLVYPFSTFVITGDFEEISRKELEEKIFSLNGICKSGVTYQTDYVLVGYSNLNLVKNPEGKSSKLIRAEKLREEGATIKIIDGTIWSDRIMNEK